MFKAKHIMSTRVFTVGLDETADRAIALLAEHRLSGLPVVAESGDLVGIVSESDLLDLVFDCFTEQGKVRDYMSTEWPQVDEETDWVDVADIVRADGAHMVPVTRDGKLVGLITCKDLLRTIRDARHLVREVLSQQS